MSPGADQARRRAIEEAALWHARMLPGAAGLDDPAAVRAGFDDWLAAAPQHAQAWNTVQAMAARLRAVPAPVATPVLQRRQRSTSRDARRDALYGLAAAGVLGTGAWMGWRHLPWPPWQARYATGPGERRRLALADGGALQLDTRTRLDIDYSPQWRRLQLHEGAILVQTHADAVQPPRPFIVETPQGRIEALGTRFEVRSDPDSSRVTVLEHAVRTTPARSGASWLVRAGEQLRFTAEGAHDRSPAGPGAAAWTQGRLVVADQPLRQVLTELGRYRRGWLDCDAAVAGLRISGVLPLDDTDQALATLQDGFPLRIERQWGGWRTRVVAR